MARETRRGGILPVLIFLLSALMVCMAMCMDVGRAVARKNQLSDACDMSALAGATQLPQSTRAQTVSQTVFAANVSSPATYSTTTTTDTIVTSAQEDVQTSFAKIAGIDYITVHAGCRVARSGTVPNQINGNIAPWGVDRSIYVTGNDVTLKMGGGSGVNGNYYALALGGTGASVYQNNIEFGWNGTLGTGDSLTANTQTGVMAGPTSTAVNYRVNQALANPNYMYDTSSNFSPTDPRIIFVPMVDTWADLNGNTQVSIMGFAAVYLVGMQGNSVTGRFVSVSSSYLSYNSSRPAAQDYGLRYLTITN